MSKWLLLNAKWAIFQLYHCENKSYLLMSSIYMRHGIQGETFNYPLANKVAKGYSNATVRPSVRPSQFEDTKVVIRICISKKNRQHNDQKKKNKRTNNEQVIVA
jgi:hypothetical protein